jgi:hypothetical protein
MVKVYLGSCNGLIYRYEGGNKLSPRVAMSFQLMLTQATGKQKYIPFFTSTTLI